MQLPPTVLSLNDKQEKAKRTTEAKAGKSSKSTQLKAAGGDTPGSSPSDDDEDEGIVASTTKLALNSQRGSRLVPPSTLETTLFDRLEAMYGASIKRMLEVQYRYVRPFAYPPLT